MKNSIFACVIALLTILSSHISFAQEPTIAYKLAVLDTGNRSLNKESEIIAKYEDLLTVLSARFDISENAIADQTWAVVQYLKNKGIKTSALEMMRGVAVIENAKSMGMDYSSTISAIATMMISEASK